MPLSEEDLADIRDYVSNAFCPTGKGGGKDPTCSPNKSGGGLGDQLHSIKSDLASAAQKVYDEWDASDLEMGDAEVGFGGICQDIAAAMGDAIGKKLDGDYDVAEVDNQGMGEQHVWLVVYDKKSAYEVDIPPSVYETGGGYSWKKIEGVKFTEGDISITPLDRDLVDDMVGNYQANWWQFVPGVNNVFCPTGKGGGVDPSCKSITVKSGEVLHPATRIQGKLLEPEVLRVKGETYTKRVKSETGEVSKVELTAKGGEIARRAVYERGTWLVGDKPAPEHVQAAGIRTDLHNVYVNLDPNATLIAQGLDSKERRVPKYSDTHNAQAAANKFGRTRELIKRRSDIMKECDTDAKNPELKERAQCLKLVMQTGIRPGCVNCKTQADFESFGAVSLKGNHVKTAADGSVSLEFVTGKSHGVTKTFAISDPKTARMLTKRASKAGPDGNLFDVDEGTLRNYSKGKDGGGFKTKDHRTALGTETAVAEIKRIGSRKKFATMKEYKEAVKQVAVRVSSLLGNTPAVALKSYIDPQVFVGWKSPKVKVK
jgi:DNA topoisomerase IB